MGLPSEGMAFPLYEFFMNTAPWNKFDYFTGARGRDAPRRYNRDTTRQARVNWKRYHTHGAGEYNRARSLVVHQFPESLSGAILIVGAKSTCRGPGRQCFHS